MQTQIYSTSKAWNLETYVESSSQNCWTDRTCRSASSCRLVRDVRLVQLAWIPFYQTLVVQRPGCHVVQAWPVTICNTTQRLDIRNIPDFQQHPGFSCSLPASWNSPLNSPWRSVWYHESLRSYGSTIPAMLPIHSIHRYSTPQAVASS